MADEPYRVSNTSRYTAEVERVLSPSSDGTTRRVLRANLHHNPQRPDEVLKITIVHQRRAGKAAWDDVESTPLSKLKANEAAKLTLSSEETLALRRELESLYALYDHAGIKGGKRSVVDGEPGEFIRTDRERAAVVRALLEQGHGAEIWRSLLESDPDLLTRLSDARLQQQRKDALAKFRELLSDDAAEPAWQKFIDSNTWIFGYGLDYRVLDLVQSQPDYGGRGVDGRGGHRGDVLAATEGDVRFTVLVELKRPSAPLLGLSYRSRTYPPSKELAGGIAQLQTNCHRWVTEGSRTDSNRDALGHLLTVQPKGILVVGQTNQLDDRDKRVAFELIRRNTVNPEIITFDELLARADFIVQGHPSRRG